MDRDAILVDERDVRPARDGRDRLRRAQLAYHEVEGHAGVLLGLDSMRTHEVALLTLLLDEYQARQHQAEDGHDHEQLRQAEAALIEEEGSHGHHRWAMIMLTVAALVVPAAACPAPVIGV